MGPRIRTTQIKANMAASGRSPSYGGSKKNLSKSKSGKSVGLRALIEGGAKGGGLLGLGGLPARINILIVQGKPRGSGGLFGCFGDGKVYAEEQLELVGNENNPSSEFKLANRLRDNGYEVNTYSLWATDGDIVRHGCVCVNKEVFTCARQFSAHIKFLQDAKVAITPILMPGWEGNGWRTWFTDGECKEAIDLRGVASDFKSEVLRLQERYRFTETKEEKLTKIKKVFEKADANSDGVIDQQELCEAFRSMDVTISDEDVLSVINEADSNGDGRIDFDEFMEKMGPILRR